MREAASSEQVRGAKPARKRSTFLKRLTLPPRAIPPPWLAATDREAASAAGLAATQPSFPFPFPFEQVYGVAAATKSDLVRTPLRF